ncbi:MAG: hypothetical protein V4519_01110 [Patescibacteria group bacterium]
MHTRGFIIIVLIYTFVFSSVIGTVSAQEAQLPQVSIQNLSIDQSDLKAGDTITGSFVISNAYPKDVPNIVYKISLVGAFDETGLPLEEYDSKTFGPIYLKADEQHKLITYSYVLPKAFNQKETIALRARAYLDSGIPLGWNDTEIEISGGSTVLSFVGSTVSVDGKFFQPDIGPTVYATSTSAFVRVRFVNNTTESITIMPTASFYTRSITTKPVTVLKKEGMIIAAKAKGEVIFDLPRFDNKAGVYLGQVQFPDKDGANRMTSLDFQYIVAGNQVTIDTVSADKSDIKKNDVVTLKVSYAGAPYDLLTARAVGAGNATLGVKIYDEHNKLVAENSSEHDFSAGTEKDVALTATRDARAMRAEVTVVKGSDVLATYKASLSANYDEMSKLPASSDGSSSGTSSAVVAAVLTIIGLGVILAVILFMRSRAKKTVYVLAALLIGTGFFFANAHEVDAAAFTITKSESINCIIDKATTVYTGPQPHCEPGNFRPQITNINTPANQIDPGEQFQFAGTVKLLSCANTPAHVKITATFQGQTKEQWYFKYNGVADWNFDHDYPLTSKDFSTHLNSKFTAPSKPGVYRLTFRIDNYTRIGNQHQPDNPNGQTGIRGYTEGYMDITVGNPVVEPTVNLTATPNPVDYNTASTLKWSSTNATTCTASNGWTGTKAKSGTQTTGNLTTKKTYTISCTGPGGSASDTITVNVKTEPTPSPVVTFTANPTTILEGQNTNLSWSSTNATACEASITSASPDASATTAWNSNTNPSATPGLHSKVVPTLTKTTTFKIICTGPGGSAEKTALVTVNKKSVTPVVNTPNVTLIASKTTVTSGETVALTYSPVYAASCTATASPANSGWTSGTESASTGSYTKTSSPLTANTTFTISCIGDSTTNGQTVTDDVTVIVDTTGGNPTTTPPPTVVLTANPDAVNPGGSTTLSWTVSNAASCTASANPVNSTWIGNKTATNGTHTATVSNIYSATEFRLTCTGQGGVESDTAVVTLATSTLSCTPNPSSGVRVGDTVTWTANPGNLSPTEYTWTGTPELEEGTSGSSIDVTYTTKGIKYAYVTATLGDGTKSPQTQCTIPVSVGNKPTFIEF